MCLKLKPCRKVKAALLKAHSHWRTRPLLSGRWYEKVIYMVVLRLPRLLEPPSPASCLQTTAASSALASVCSSTILCSRSGLCCGLPLTITRDWGCKLKPSVGVGQSHGDEHLLCNDLWLIFFQVTITLWCDSSADFKDNHIEKFPVKFYPFKCSSGGS